MNYDFKKPYCFPVRKKESKASILLSSLIITAVFMVLTIMVFEAVMQEMDNRENHYSAVKIIK